MASRSMQLVKLVLVATTPEATHSPRELLLSAGTSRWTLPNTVDDPDGPNRHDHAKAGTMTGKYG
jgi:hypothetical protein